MSAAVAHITPERVDHVLAHLWERGRVELEDLGVPLSLARAECLEHAALGTGWAILSDGVPVVLTGLVRTGPRSAGTWFLATDDFERAFREVTALILERLPAECERLGFEEVEILSACRHPKADRWFKAMGFTSDPGHNGATASGVPIRRYVKSVGGHHVLG